MGKCYHGEDSVHASKSFEGAGEAFNREERKVKPVSRASQYPRHFLFRLSLRSRSPHSLSSPSRTLSYHRIAIVAEFVQSWEELSVTAVPHRDHRISPQTTELGSADWRSAKDLTKLFALHDCQPLERRINQSLAHLELRGIGHRCFTVPRAYVLADVAPEDVPAHAVPHLFGNGSPFLDGQVRDAFVRIELIGTKKRVRWTSVEAARAGAAPIRGGQIGRQLKGCKNHAQEQPGPHLLVQDAGILADPAHARVLRVHPLDQGPRIDIAARL